MNIIAEEKIPNKIGLSHRALNDSYCRHGIQEETISDVLKSSLFETSKWGSFCDVTLTLKQARKSDDGTWIKIDEYQCRRAFRHFMNLLNRAVYGNAVRRHNKRIRVVCVLEKEGFVRDPRETTVFHRGKWMSALPVKEYRRRGRWHFHCAIELPVHVDTIRFEQLIYTCWAKVHWGLCRILVRDGTNEGWIDYMLKLRQKAQFESWTDCIDLDSLHNPIADA